MLNLNFRDPDLVKGRDIYNVRSNPNFFGGFYHASDVGAGSPKVPRDYS